MSAALNIPIWHAFADFRGPRRLKKKLKMLALYLMGKR